MSLTGTGALGGAGGVALLAIVARATGVHTVLLSDAGYAAMATVASAIIGGIVTITVTAISVKATQRSRDEAADAPPPEEDPDELRRRAAAIDRRRRRGK